MLYLRCVTLLVRLFLEKTQTLFRLFSFFVFLFFRHSKGALRAWDGFLVSHVFEDPPPHPSFVYIFGLCFFFLVDFVFSKVFFVWILAWFFSINLSKFFTLLFISSFLLSFFTYKFICVIFFELNFCYFLKFSYICDRVRPSVRSFVCCTLNLFFTTFPLS